MSIDSRVHRLVLDGFVREGGPPAAAELAAALHVASEDVEASLRRLHEGHGLVLHPGRADVWIAHPFSASPTTTWITAQSTGWWSPCLWCAFGAVALVAPNAVIHCRLGGEAEPVAIEVRGGRPQGELWVHFSLPPRRAWDNVVHFCATVQPFRRPDDADAWCARHRLPRGATVPVAKVAELGRVWYARHLDEDWVKWSVPEAQDIFDRVGLSGDFWKLPDGGERF